LVSLACFFTCFTANFPEIQYFFITAPWCLALPKHASNLFFFLVLSFLFLPHTFELKKAGILELCSQSF